MKFKTVIVIFSLSASGFSGSFAEDALVTPGQWYLQGGGGIVFPASSQESSLYDPGIDGEVQVGIMLTKDFGLGVESSLDSLPLDRQEAINAFEQQEGVTGVTGSTTARFTQFSLNLVERYYLPFLQFPRFYLFLGAGVAFDSFGGDYSVSWPGSSQTGPFVPENWTNFELAPGLGVAFPISNQLNAFAQGKIILDFASTDGPNPESNESPIAGIPVLGGVQFTFP